MVEVTPEESGRQPRRRVCPQCGVPVHKVHRSLRDRLVSVFYDVGRYHCSDCGWQGLLVRSRTTQSSRSRPARLRVVWIVVSVLLIPLVGLSAALYWIGEHAQQMPMVPGQSIAGMPLEPNDPRKQDAGPAGELRRGCVWGGPDESPYLGTLTVALTAAGLPSEIIGKFEIMREGRLVSNRLEISSAGIHSADHRRYFGHTTNAMGLGDTLCFSTRTNLPSDTVIAADLYELIDDNDRRFTIMIVARGGNVATLEEQFER
jgi:predicted RNA-binding Zn-ribbon protein involved in translation (DUF1610 family)